MNRKILEFMIVSNKGEMYTIEKLEQPITGLKDSEEVTRIRNEIFPFYDHHSKI